MDLDSSDAQSQDPDTKEPPQEEADDGSTVPAPKSRSRGKGHQPQGVNVSMHYVQREDGTVIDSHVAKTICQHARSIFIVFAQQGRLFTVWGDVDTNCYSFYYDEMATRLEELGFCDYDWKADQIAMDVYDNNLQPDASQKKPKTSAGDIPQATGTAQNSAMEGRWAPVT